MADILFTVEKSAVVTALTLVAGAVGRKEKTPILAHILVSKIDDRRLLLTASNLNQEMSCAFPAEVAPDFESIALPAQTFVDVVKLAPDADMSVATRRSVGLGRIEGVDIRAGQYRARMQILPGSDYPLIPRPSNSAVVELGSETLLSAIDTVAWAAEKEARVNWSLCGIRLHPVKGDLVVVATDRYRMAKRVIPRSSLDEDMGDVPAITIPNDAIKLLTNLLRQGDTTSLEISAERLCITAGNATLVTKLIDEPFLNYTQLAPARDGVTVSFDSNQLEASIGRVMAFADEKKHMSLDIRPDGITIYSRRPDGDDATDAIPASATGALQQGFNGDNLADALKKLGCDKVDFVVSPARSACFMTSSADPLTTMAIGPLAVPWIGQIAAGVAA